MCLLLPVIRKARLPAGKQVQALPACPSEAALDKSKAMLPAKGRRRCRRSFAVQNMAVQAAMGTRQCSIWLADRDPIQIQFFAQPFSSNVFNG